MHSVVGVIHSCSKSVNLYRVVLQKSHVIRAQGQGASGSTENRASYCCMRRRAGVSDPLRF